MPTLCKKKHLGISYKAKKQALLSPTITQNVERNVTFVTSSSKKRLWQAPFCDFLRKAMFAKPLEEFQVRTHKILNTCLFIVRFLNLLPPCRASGACKGQIISKAKCQATDSPKKQTNEFVFLAFLPFMSKKNKFIRSFVFWENLRRTNLLSKLTDL